MHAEIDGARARAGGAGVARTGIALRAAMTNSVLRLASSVVMWGSIVVIAACGQMTSLGGPTSCGEADRCEGGQLCLNTVAGPDDAGGLLFCVTVPLGCPVSDCEGADCPTCIAKLCPAYPSGASWTRVNGRTLTCP